MTAGQAPARRCTLGVSIVSAAPSMPPQNQRLSRPKRGSQIFQAA